MLRVLHALIIIIEKRSKRSETFRSARNVCCHTHEKNVSIHLMRTDQRSYTVQKVLSILGSSATRMSVLSAERAGKIPTAARREGRIRTRQWRLDELPKLGAKFGFLRPLGRPFVATVFTAKGGVFKTTIGLNLARMVALHNIRVCVVGLDQQCDMTNALGLAPEVDDEYTALHEALKVAASQQGLREVFEGSKTVSDVLLQTDIPTLYAVPETPFLEVVERGLVNVRPREEWLRERVVNTLKESFDLVVIDCPPSWNNLTYNAIAACDALISPIECKVHNYNSLELFQAYIGEFKRDMKLGFEHILVPTHWVPARKLSSTIRQNYVNQIAGCTNCSIRESTKGEEAQAEQISLPEYAPTSLLADEMRGLVAEIWERFQEAIRVKASDAA